MTKIPEVFPTGVLVFTHTEIPAERVPFMTEEELVNRFQEACDQGLKPNEIFPYVRTGRHDVAEKLFAIMDKSYGARHDIYSLTPENLDTVLGDFRVTIPAQQA